MILFYFSLLSWLRLAGATAAARYQEGHLCALGNGLQEGVHTLP